MKNVGIYIRKSREEKGISLRELAKKLSVSASFLSQVETNKASPSLSTLKSIANALQTTVSALIGETQNQPTNPIVRKNEQKPLREIADGIEVFLLTSSDPCKQMAPLLFKLKENANSGKSTEKHFGQEFVTVLKGALEITLSDKNYILKKGDNIYFNSNTPHSFKNIHNGTTEALWVDTPPNLNDIKS